MGPWDDSSMAVRSDLAAAPGVLLRLNLVFEPPELLSVEQRAEGLALAALAVDDDELRPSPEAHGERQDGGGRAGSGDPSKSSPCVEDLSRLITRRFDLASSCAHGIALQVSSATPLPGYGRSHAPEP